MGCQRRSSIRCLLCAMLLLASLKAEPPSLLRSACIESRLEILPLPASLQSFSTPRSFHVASSHRRSSLPGMTGDSDSTGDAPRLALRTLFWPTGLTASGLAYGFRNDGHTACVIGILPADSVSFSPPLGSLGPGRVQGLTVSLLNSIPITATGGARATYEGRRPSACNI